MSNRPYNVVVDLMDLYWDDPNAFAEDMLSFFPDENQAPVLDDLAHHNLITVRSGQGVGKTGIEAVAVLWFLTCRPNPRVVCTAPTRQQLNDVLWAEIGKWLESSRVERLLRWTKTKVYMIGHEKRWFATARTATRPENMQGFHEDYMLFIADEASGIDDKIMEAILGTLSGAENKLLMCGNPTKTSGAFYDSHHKDRESYRAHKISSRNSGRTNKQTIAMLERKYGKDSDIVRVRVDGEFPKSEPDVFIPLELPEQAVMTDVTEFDSEGKPVLVGPLEIGVDVARYGNDETVLAWRVGTYIGEMEAYNKQGTTETAGNVIQLGLRLMKEYNRPTIAIKIDDTGVGGGVTDIMAEQANDLRGRWTIVPCNFGGAGDEKYDDAATIWWSHARDLLQERKLRLPNDEKLIGQLSTRKYKMTSKGKIKIERKEDMKKRGLDSPDRADALVLCLNETGVNVKDNTQTIKQRPVTSGLRRKTF